MSSRAKKDKNIAIVGAGVSGLIAAQVLEQNGYAPVIYEASDRVGGRVKTDVINGFQLDHGFQVLLSSYPAAQHYLDYDALELQYFKAGACVFKDGKQRFIGDPLRDKSILFKTLFSGIGNLWDKLRILKLNKILEKISINEIFEKEETTTLEYLQSFGFSDKMIVNFFKPFFTGIFLETELKTSSRMFEFVFKMFGDGYAVLPKSGIEAISQQLCTRLESTKIHYHTKVEEIKSDTVLLSNGDEITCDATIIATEASYLVKNLEGQNLSWKSCDALYFATDEKVYPDPFIGLVSQPNSLINNLFYHTSLETTSKGDGELMSVTVVKQHDLNEEDLVDAVIKELANYCGIENVKFLKRYEIKRALPELSDLKYEVEPSATKLFDRVFLAGDVQLNGSLNAAMIAGEKAASGVIEYLGN